MIGNKGGVHYIVHQSEVLRVAGCRLVEANNEQEQNSPVEQTETKTFKNNKSPVKKETKTDKDEDNIVVQKRNGGGDRDVRNEEEEREHQVDVKVDEEIKILEAAPQ